MTEEHQPPPPGWEMSGTNNWDDYENHTPSPLTLQALRKTLERGFVLDQERQRRLQEERRKRAERMNALLDGVDFDRLPMAAKNLLWLLDSGGPIGPKAAAWLEGELNEVRRPRP